MSFYKTASTVKYRFVNAEYLLQVKKGIPSIFRSLVEVLEFDIEAMSPTPIPLLQCPQLRPDFAQVFSCLSSVSPLRKNEKLETGSFSLRLLKLHEDNVTVSVFNVEIFSLASLSSVSRSV